MRLMCFLPILVGSLAGTVFGDLQPPVAGYSVMNLTWDVVPNIAGAEAVNITGTLQDVLNYLNTTYSDYPFPAVPDFNTSYGNASSNATTNNTVGHTSGDTDYCYNYPAASTQYIWDGIQYLLGITGDGMNGPGPGNCGQVSCSSNSAIWWCNDNQTPYSVSFESVAFAAWHIVDGCYDSKAHLNEISGQIMNPDDWNVIIRESSC